MQFHVHLLVSIFASEILIFCFYNFGSSLCPVFLIFEHRKGFVSGNVKVKYKWLWFLSAILLLIYGMIRTRNKLFAARFEQLDSSTSLSVGVKSIVRGSGSERCDLFYGRWIYNKSYPLYNSSTCPFAETGFRCHENGRTDQDYMKWRWQPYGCDIPRFNAETFLERLKGYRIAFVGDSMGRTQWESFICLLMQGIQGQQTVVELNGNKITKRIPYLAVRFKMYNLTVEYYRSVFLVKKGSPPKHVPKRVHSTLKLDQPDLQRKLLGANVLIFNTGRWWTATKTFQVGCYFQVGDSLKLGMSIIDAYQKALSTWASWVERRVDTKKTRVFFRSFEPSHWEGSFTKGSCQVAQHPKDNPGELGNYTFSEFSHGLANVVSNMQVPVAILNVTTLSAYRNDAHVGNWSGLLTAPDCSHWCLPGVPDTWNELLFASLFMKGNDS